MTVQNANLIRAVLDGKMIQAQRRHGAPWQDIEQPESAIAALLHSSNWSFRIKPEPRFARARLFGGVFYGDRMTAEGTLYEFTLSEDMHKIVSFRELSGNV